MHLLAFVKRSGLALLVWLALLLPLAFAVPHTQAAVPPGYAPKGPGNIYLALGDSLVIGYEEPANEDGKPGYPDNLLDYLKTINSQIELKKLGLKGETSSSMIDDGDGKSETLSQLQQAEQFIAEQRAKGKRIGLVTLSIGGNDIISILPPPVGKSTAPATALATYRDNLGQILDRLKSALTVNDTLDGDILLMDYYNPYPGFSLPQFGIPDKLADIWVPQFNAATKEVAAARGIAVAEVAQAIQGREVELLYVKRTNTGEYIPISIGDLITEQGQNKIKANYDFHPRPAGHLVIAEEFVKVSGYVPSAPERKTTRLAFVAR